MNFIDAIYLNLTDFFQKKLSDIKHSNPTLKN